ncbi:hypothetical protein AXF42_Ash010000 [Apostasia shenzhenica]|uniref:Uncharacterized protein n=1 Tax=Apostasia shenzhenica TaxID=1088818 RepID=A0A2I0ACK5_9ASPA|nr:hypothetical protein AXF42_Ash010000 [Apostasia shenzhenica]
MAGPQRLQAHDYQVNVLTKERDSGDFQRSANMLHMRPFVKGDSCMSTLLESDAQRITNEILARRIKNRERQRRYRARKRLEADMQRSYLIEPRLSWPAEGIESYGTTFSLDASMISAAYEARVYSGRKWKKEARQAYFSERLGKLEFGQKSSEVELIAQYPSNPRGRRDWKADARSKMEMGAREHDRLALGLSV